MIIIPPVSQPQPAIAIVAPAPVLKQARSQQRVRTETMNAVDGMERSDRSAQTTGQKYRRGELVDIFV